MEALLLDEQEIRALLERRRMSGGDRYDEVWEGTYVVSPLATNEHQRIVSALTHAFIECVAPGSVVLAGANVSDRERGWEENYRCPDVVVVLPGSGARDAGTHWVAGPDLLFEVVSPNDRSRAKLAFYARIGVREVVLIERDTKVVEVFRLEGPSMVSAGVSAAATPARLDLTTVAVTLQHRPNPPAIVVTERTGLRSWTI